MYTIKGIILDVSIDALHYFSYNNQMTLLFLHCTLQYLYWASLSGELSYARLLYSFNATQTKIEDRSFFSVEATPFFWSRLAGLKGIESSSSERCWKPLIPKEHTLHQEEASNHCYVSQPKISAYQMPMLHIESHSSSMNSLKIIWKTNKQTTVYNCMQIFQKGEQASLKRNDT